VGWSGDLVRGTLEVEALNLVALERNQRYCALVGRQFRRVFKQAIGMNPGLRCRHREPGKAGFVAFRRLPNGPSY
jgi:hypothetical protein